MWWWTLSLLIHRPTRQSWHSLVFASVWRSALRASTRFHFMEFNPVNTTPLGLGAFTSVITRNRIQCVRREKEWPSVLRRNIHIELGSAMINTTRDIRDNSNNNIEKGKRFDSNSRYSTSHPIRQLNMLWGPTSQSCHRGGRLSLSALPRSSWPTAAGAQVN